MIAGSKDSSQSRYSHHPRSHPFTMAKYYLYTGLDRIMRTQRIWKDPGFWVLMGVNVYLVFHYYQHPEIFTTLIWLYWCQSVLLGVFNVLDMVTVKLVAPGAYKQDGLTGITVKGFSAVFFIFHYGFFHLVYLVFIATMKPRYPIQWDFFKYFIGAFIAGQIITFVQHKILQKRTNSAAGASLLTPYIRIVPMHLTILLPSFFHISNLGVFLVLKTAADAVMYIVTKPRGDNNRLSNEAMLASQQAMRM